MKHVDFTLTLGFDHQTLESKHEQLVVKQQKHWRMESRLQKRLSGGLQVVLHQLISNVTFFKFQGFSLTHDPRFFPIEDWVWISKQEGIRTTRFRSSKLEKRS
jgi:hypothetical protein